MATHSKTDAKRERLKSALRERCRRGQILAGRSVPSVRDLATEFDLSKKVVTASLQELVEEGVLYTIPRVGTFAGQLQNDVVDSDELYVFVIGSEGFSLRSFDNHRSRMLAGFEQKIARQGGSTLFLRASEFLALYPDGLPGVKGVFDLSWELPEEWIRKQGEYPFVVRILTSEVRAQFDVVSFDDKRGGLDATQHLLKRGHKCIAFLGFHRLAQPEYLSSGEVVQESEGMYWSRDRAAGWCEAMRLANRAPEGLLYVPDFEVTLYSSEEEQRQIAADIARKLLPRLESGEVTGVVTANDYAAAGLVDALHQASTPLGCWPAIISFDDEVGDVLQGEEQARVITSLRLPWDELGRNAAELLWERVHGGRKSAPTYRKVPMQLIPRLSCRAEWPRQAQSLSLFAGKTKTRTPEMLGVKT
jgi:DNA-binding LacI/PurR family transcriptional regulator